MPITLEKFSGKHYTIGQEQGSKFKLSLEVAFSQALPGAAAPLLAPRWLPPALHFPWAKWSAASSARAAGVSACPEQRRRLAGIADGADLDEGQLLFWKSLEEAWTRLIVPLNAPQFAASLKASGSAETAIAAFVSNPLDIGLRPFVCRTEPAGRYATLSVSDPSQAGTWFGVNERGLAATFCNVFYRGQKFGGAPPSLLVQDLLERVQSLDEAAGFLQAGHLPMGGNFLLAEPGRAAALELTGNSFQVRDPAKGFLHIDHFFQSEALAAPAVSRRLYRPFFSRLDPDPELEKTSLARRTAIARLRGRAPEIDSPLTLAKLLDETAKESAAGEMGEHAPHGHAIPRDPIVALVPERRALVWMERLDNGELSPNEFSF